VITPQCHVSREPVRESSPEAVKNPEEENRKKAQGYDSNPDVKYVIQVCVLYIPGLPHHSQCDSVILLASYS
jgi:hypothetical protein